MPQGKVQLRGFKSLECRNIIISEAKVIEVSDKCKYMNLKNNVSPKSVKFAPMPHEKIQNNFTGGLDADSQENFVKPTDWRYALNIRAGVAYAGRMGAITNLKGNTEVQYDLPSGTNTCIGAYEDKQDNTVIYFIANENGGNTNGLILRYFPEFNRIDLQLEYDFGWTDATEITGINLVNGRLLYWLDPTPHKVNIEKSRLVLPDGSGKKKSWQIILGQTQTNPDFFQVVVKTMAGASVASINVTVNAGSVEEKLKELAAQINSGLSAYFTAEACDCHIELTEVQENYCYPLLTLPSYMVVPDNWYGLTLTDRMFDRSKWMPLNEPVATYLQDTTFLYNYVKNKVFQFRLKYRYDDFENSVLGVISQIPITNLQCDGTNAPEKNYIQVNFNDNDILAPQDVTLLKDVSVLAREGNDGDWREVIQLRPCDFLDFDNGTNEWTAYYNFYNNIVSTSVADDDVRRQYDDVPLTAEDDLIVKNRSIMANVVKGYDAPECADATWSVDVADTRSPKMYKVRGKIRILSYMMGDALFDRNGEALPPYIQLSFYTTFNNSTPASVYWKYPFWQSSDPDINYVLRRGGIFHDTSRTDDSDGGNFAFFGGGGFGSGAGGDFGIRAGMETMFDQRIPEGGFPVYSAGTNYLTISKQIEVGLPTDSQKALDTSTPEKITAIGDYFYSGGDIYSEFELLVPEGVHVIRLASHWCSFGANGQDKLGKGFMYDLTSGTQYQKTSTNVWAVIDNQGNYLPQKELTVTVSGGDVDCGTFIVMDLAPPFEADLEPPYGVYGKNYFAWQPINGYLVNDDQNGSDINDPNYVGVSVEKAIVSYGGDVFNNAKSPRLRTLGIYPTLPIGVPYVAQPVDLDIGWNETCTTDHNGYFFGIAGATASELGAGLSGVNLSETRNYNFFPISAYGTKNGATNNVYEIRETDTLLYVGTYTDYINKTLSAINFDGSQTTDPSLVHCFVPTTKNDARENGATFVNGRVVDGTNPVSGVSAIFESGRIDVTDTDGTYEILAWSDLVTPNLGYFSDIYTFNPTSDLNRIVDDLIINVSVFCQPTYPNGQIIGNILITPYGTDPNQYNPSFPYEVSDFEVDEGNNPTQKAHKRGGQYIYSLRYYDETGRFCSVVPAFSMYIPFITEDLNILCQQGKYEDPTQYPSGTYKYGKPTVNWYLDANYKPPVWAKYYQWMRTKNSIYGRYLQWNANSVTYLSAVETETTPEIATSFQNSDATAIKIGLSNIVDYSAQNPTSQIGYSFQAADRVRIIADREIDYEQGLNDYEVVSYDATTQSIIIKNENSSVEIKSGSFVELMNVKSITDPQEQIFYEVGEVYECTAPNSPTNEHSVLNGTFTNGDTYWRGRFIPVNDDATNYAAIYPVVVEDAAVSDFYPSTSQDIGRAGVVDVNFKQIHYPTMMQNSGIYVEGSAVNGLSSFATTDYKELNRAFGGIKRLFYVGNTLISLHENKVVANYIELRSLSDANTTDGLLAVSDAYFGNDRPMQSEYGCQHGKSAFQWNGLVYFLDASKGVICRYDNNGMDAISDKGMRSYFRDLCKDGVNNAKAVFDPYYRQYIITIDAVNGVRTIAWDEEKNRWTSEYSFAGEDYASILRSIVSFKDGKLWLHDSNTTHNNFYGTQYSSKVKNIVVSGTNRSTYHTLTLQAVQADPLQNDWQVLEITNEFNQLSRIKKPHFRLKENVWAASFLRDTTDTTVTNPIINGRNLRSQTLTLLFDNDSTDAVYLQTVTTKILPSERQ